MAKIKNKQEALQNLAMLNGKRIFDKFTMGVINDKNNQHKKHN